MGSRSRRHPPSVRDAGSWEQPARPSRLAELVAQSTSPPLSAANPLLLPPAGFLPPPVQSRPPLFLLLARARCSPPPGSPGESSGCSGFTYQIKRRSQARRSESASPIPRPHPSTGRPACHPNLRSHPLWLHEGPRGSGPTPSPRRMEGAAVPLRPGGARGHCTRLTCAGLLCCGLGSSRLCKRLLISFQVLDPTVTSTRQTEEKEGSIGPASGKTVCVGWGAPGKGCSSRPP